MEETVGKFLNNIFETLFPSGITCFLCGDEVSESKFDLCNKCEAKIPRVKKICLKCGTPINSMANYCLTCKNTKRFFDLARSALIYKEDVAGAIRNFKYGGKKYLAKCFAKFLNEELNKLNLTEIDYIIPVPLFPKRLKKRGYNQAQLLAEELSKTTLIPIDTTSLIRVKDTETQTELSYRQRQNNLEDAFKVENKKKLKGKTVLLIDDVLTTGSTANHCSKILKDAGVKVIYVLTVATTENDLT